MVIQLPHVVQAEVLEVCIVVQQEVRMELLFWWHIEILAITETRLAIRV